MNAKTQSKGFTLVELMVTVAIVGILAAIAYPSYTQYVIRANRADAQQALMQLQQNMERYFTSHRSYTDAEVGSNVGPSQSPESGDAVYTFAIEDLTASSYTLVATPESGKANADNGIVAINSRGAKFWDENNDGSFGTGEDNWEKD